MSPNLCLIYWKSKYSPQDVIWALLKLDKGHPPSVDLRYGEEDTISSSTLIFAAKKG